MKTALTALAALLLTGSLAAQEAPPADTSAPTTKTKIKTKRAKSSTRQNSPTTATAALLGVGTPPTTPPTEETVTVRGTVQHLAQGLGGEITAAVLADGTVLRLPPTAAQQLAQQLKTGIAVAATGTLRAAQPGEAAAKSVRVVHAQTLTLGGTQFLVR